MGSGHSKHGKQTEMKTKQNPILHVLKGVFRPDFFYSIEKRRDFLHRSRLMGQF